MEFYSDIFYFVQLMINTPLTTPTKRSLRYLGHKRVLVQPQLSLKNTIYTTVFAVFGPTLDRSSELRFSILLTSIVGASICFTFGVAGGSYPGLLERSRPCRWRTPTNW